MAPRPFLRTCYTRGVPDLLYILLVVLLVLLIVRVL